MGRISMEGYIVKNTFLDGFKEDASQECGPQSCPARVSHAQTKRQRKRISKRNRAAMKETWWNMTEEWEGEKCALKAKITKEYNKVANKKMIVAETVTNNDKISITSGPPLEPPPPSKTPPSSALTEVSTEASTPPQTPPPPPPPEVQVAWTCNENIDYSCSGGKSRSPPNYPPPQPPSSEPIEQSTHNTNIQNDSEYRVERSVKIFSKGRKSRWQSIERAPYCDPTGYKYPDGALTKIARKQLCGWVASGGLETLVADVIKRRSEMDAFNAIAAY